MDENQLQSVRRFNRLVTRRVGALEVDYLRRGRPLAEARLIFEISADGADVRALRCKLGLDSGYLSRLLQSLKTQGLIAVTKGDDDGRRRHVNLTRKGAAERAAYDRLSTISRNRCWTPSTPPSRLAWWRQWAKLSD
jgi:DNA-binding MarR family transcriptional regulator